jgi:hypothetical protein
MCEDDDLKWTRTLFVKTLPIEVETRLAFLLPALSIKRNQNHSSRISAFQGPRDWVVRPGQSLSEIVLVFPVDIEGKPRRVSQQVKLTYSFKIIASEYVVYLALVTIVYIH